MRRVRTELKSRTARYGWVKRFLNAILNLVENLGKTRKKLKPIARKRHNYIYLLIAILLTIITSYLFVNFSPFHKFLISAVTIPILPIFFAILGLLIFSLSTFIFIGKQHGVVITLIVLGYLLMRLIGLTHWIFLTLSIALLITVELFLIKKK